MRQGEKAVVDEKEFSEYFLTHSAADVCKKFNIARGTVYSIANRLGLKKTKEDKSKIIKAGIADYVADKREVFDSRKNDIYQYYVIENHSREDTAEHFGMSMANLKSTLSKYGIRKADYVKPEGFNNIVARISKEDLEQNKYLYDRELMTKFSISQRQLDKLYEYYNIEKSIDRARQAAEHQMTLVEHPDDYIRFRYSGKASAIKFLTEFSDPLPTAFALSAYFNVAYTTIEQYIRESDLFNYINRAPQRSHYEDEIIEYIGDGYKVLRNSRSVLPSGQEIDIYIPELKLGIEFNGTYWHSDMAGKPKKYHFLKSKEAYEAGIRLIQIYEYEYIIHKERILIMLDSALGRMPKIYARNCEIREITNTEAKPFSDKTHLQGHRNASVTYGLFYNDELVQLMSFGKTRNAHANGAEWEIIRGCPGSNNMVTGGVSKLFKHFIDDYKPSSVFSYCDFNKFNGKSYEAIGMKFIGYTDPDMKWVMPDHSVVDRDPHRRAELESLAVGRIYGAGSKKYLWTRGI